jgi:hypothetical protein
MLGAFLSRRPIDVSDVRTIGAAPRDQAGEQITVGTMLLSR